MPIDFLKIDKSFVMAMGSDEASRTIVMSVLAMAGTLNIDVVAEGIESDGTLVQLQETGCKFGQGFLFARPLPVDEIEALLANDSREDRDVEEVK